MVLSSVASEKIFQRKDLRMSVVESLEYALSNISLCELEAGLWKADLRWLDLRKINEILEASSCKRRERMKQCS